MCGIPQCVPLRVARWPWASWVAFQTLEVRLLTKQRAPFAEKRGFLPHCAGHGAWQAVGPVGPCQVPLSCQLSLQALHDWRQSCRRIILQAQGGGAMHRPLQSPEVPCLGLLAEVRHDGSRLALSSHRHISSVIFASH